MISTIANGKTPRDAVGPCEQEDPPRQAELEQAIRHAIVQRIGRRISALEIEVIDDRIVISGYAPCYYLKQLVLEGVLDILGPAGAGGVEFNVQVAASPPQSVESAD